MNLNLDFSVVSRVLRGLLSELRHKRLWPVAAVLLAGIVAVPVLLSKSSKPAPQAQAPLPAIPRSSGSSLPAINVQSTPVHAKLSARGRNPFGAAAGSGGSSTSLTSPSSTAVTSVANAAQSAVNALSGAAGVSTGSSTGSSASGTSSTSSSGAPSSPSSTPPSITGNSKPKPVHSGLSSTQAYDVALSITNSVGGVDTIDPLGRLSILPSTAQPRLIELGVLQGGRRVLFALQPGTHVNGPGSCIPGPIDCEVLELGQDQTESVSTQTPTGLSQVALFAVTGITVTNYSSVAAARKARQAGSAAGRALLSQSSLPTLSLFKYEPSRGSVVDLRNLTVGGS
jgi:hypothetical protein